MFDSFGGKVLAKQMLLYQAELHLIMPQSTQSNIYNLKNFKANSTWPGCKRVTVNLQFKANFS